MLPAVREIAGAVDETLRPEGFKRRRVVWNRGYEQLVDVVDLQVSKGLDAVTLNCGVFDPAVHRVTWGEDPPALVSESKCMARARIGELLAGRDVWWSVDEPGQAATELASLVRTAVLPFLNAMHDPAAFDDFMAKRVEGKRWPDLATQVYRAVRMHQRGDDDAARAILRDVAASPSGWHDKAFEVATRLFGDPQLW